MERVSVKRRRRDAAKPRVEEHAKRALKPWVSGCNGFKPCKGEAGICIALTGLFPSSILTQGSGRSAASTLGFAASRFQRWDRLVECSHRIFNPVQPVAMLTPGYHLMPLRGSTSGAGNS